LPEQRLYNNVFALFEGFKMADSEATADAAPEKDVAESETSAPRKIPGNLPYLTSSGTLKRVLERLIDAQRPDKFNTDFLADVLKLTGGAARATVPILKKMGFLSSDGTPTDLYAKFRTETGRGGAALHGLRSAYVEIFKRSEYAHLADDNKLRDIIVEITGLKSNDPVAAAIRGTFNVVKSFVTPGAEASVNSIETSKIDDEPSAKPTTSVVSELDGSSAAIRLAYNINIVLPETSDLAVLNAIFKSIRENLMR
jgi:hypothetical protein